MGVTKSELFTDSQNRMAIWSKVLAHPARIAIIEQLISTNSCVNSQLVLDLGLAQATISQHLRELKSIGIIKGNIEGASVNYCIDATVWNEIKTSFQDFFDRYPSDFCNDKNC
jgi:ArsR family transcriptional regulator, zinc-responsive transcriptional repressor